MKRLFIILLATALYMAPLTQASAQDLESVDIASVAEAVSGSDVERLLMGLNTPIPDDLLTDPFSGAEPLNPDLLGEQRAIFDETVEGLRGSTVYTVNYTPDGSGASPVATPSGTPVARQPQSLYTSATLTYLLLETPVDTSDMDGFAAMMQEALGSEAQTGTVEEITVNDAPALLISTTTVVNALDFHAEWIVVPVGNVVVVAMVMEGSETFDEQRFRADNEDLAISGVAYLASLVS